jgi:predicted dehydrogenase
VDADERVRYQGFHHGASYLEHLDFLDAIRSGRPPGVTARDGLLAVAVGIAAQQSIEEKLPVTLAELGVA